MLNLKRSKQTERKITRAMKQRWKIHQSNDHLRIEMQFQKGIHINSLVLKNPTLDIEKHLSVEKINHKFICNVNIKKFLTVLHTEEVSFLQKERSFEEQESLLSSKTGMWHWYINLSVDPQQASESLINRIETQIQNQIEKKNRVEEEEGEDVNDYTFWKQNAEGYERYLRLGRFADTVSIDGLTEVQIDSNSILTYINSSGFLTTAINENVTSKTKLQIENLKTRKGNVEIIGLLNTGYFQALNCRTVLKSRNTTEEIIIPTELHRRDTTFHTRHGRVRYDFKIKINFQSLLSLREDVYDIFLEADMPYSQDSIRFRVGRPTFRAKHFFSEFIGKSRNNESDGERDSLLINPYYTIFKSNLSFEVFPFSSSSYKYFKRIRRFSGLMRKMNQNQDVWLVGERPYKAQDTGFHFFKHMRKEYPEKNIYYVISTDSPEYENVKPYGNILEYGSKEHIKNTIIATKIFSSHHTNYLFPIRTDKFEKLVKATRIFLQHGVLGVKNMSNIYSSQSKTFKVDQFVVSSDYEKEYIMRDMQYKPKDVIVTGLSRFDELFKNNVEQKKQILIIPTWRDWIQNADIFLESEYYERYLSLVNNEDLINTAKQNNYDVVLCLHPNMQNFSSYFQDSPVKVIYQGEVDVQTLIKESALMITDYSSVAFDFSFLHKPVVYYQFDRQRFIGKRGSHIDIVNDLPGDILDDEENLVNIVQEYIHNECEMKDEFRTKANRFIKYRDEQSSERIYEEAVRYTKHERLVDRLRRNNLFKDVFNKFRKSKKYFPTMKKLYTLMRLLLPIDQKKVLFESGIGKSFGDSPKEIFEALQKERKDLKFIWVYNKNLPKPYDRTTIIKRLSPAYYYHLATSKYWVNNQNFPTYIKKSKGTIYLQTWHGTPLKRMLHDIEEIQGRDETYLERVSGAIKGWDYLVSPSEYATNCFKSAFQYNGKVIEEGYPRNDIFFREQDNWEMREIKQKLQIPEDKKVILYAPTFRDNQKKGSRFTMELPIDFETFQQQLGDEYVLLIRLHVVVSKKVKIDEEYKETIINVSNYPDIQELMKVSDMLITDYSSVFFDYLNTDKPILFYTYDLEEYRDQLRGFYMDFEQEAPGPLCLTEQSLYDAITDLNKTEIQYSERYTTAKNKFCYLDDGHAAERVVQEVFNK